VFEVKGRFDEVLAHALQDQKEELIKSFTEIIGSNENTGLPVTQAQEQQCYDKNIRNKFRKILRSALLQMKGKL